MKDNAALKGLIAIVILVALVGGTIILNQEDDEPTINGTPVEPSTTAQTPTPTESSEEMPLEESAEPASDYVDGTYTASGSYSSPAGTESIEVSVTLAGDIVEDVEVTSLGKHPTSQQFQSKFISGITALVSGVDIDSLDVDVVSGSSLTSRGFNAAIADIQSQAAQS